jgi:hypothetical protein
MMVPVSMGFLVATLKVPPTESGTFVRDDGSRFAWHGYSPFYLV